MKLDLQSLSTDTLLYMLMHSGVFVVIMGSVFFLIGLIFGHATWGRFKVQARRLAGEIEQQRQEIATLKRKLGEQAVKPGGIAMEKEAITMPAASPEPAVSIMPLVSPAEEHAPLPPPSPPLPAEPLNETLGSADPSTSTLTAKPKTPKAKTVVKAKTSELKMPAEPLPATSDAPVIASETSSAPSPLAAIIASQPGPVSPKVEKNPSVSMVEGLDIIPALPELPASSSLAEVKPDFDPQLGLVYKTPPLKADDLTAMKGIAKVLEQRLHEFGIYTYEQIASWTEDQIKEFSSRLAFKDRIHREKWVEQARKLQAMKTSLS